MPQAFRPLLLHRFWRRLPAGPRRRVAAGLAVAVAPAPTIRVDTQADPSVAVRALTAAADIVLALHRSEGFGLMLAAAAPGLGQDERI